MSTEFTARTPLPNRLVRPWVSTIVVVFCMLPRLGWKRRRVVSREIDFRSHSRGRHRQIDDGHRQAVGDTVGSLRRLSRGTKRWELASTVGSCWWVWEQEPQAPQRLWAPRR